MSLKTYSTVAKLKFSSRQDFFWLEAGKIFSSLNDISIVPKDVYRDQATGKEMNRAEYSVALKKAFAEGRPLAVSHRLVNEPFSAASHPTLAAYDPERVAEYYSIIRGRNKAISEMLNQNEGQKIKATGKVLAGGNKLDEKVFVQRLIQKHQTTTPTFHPFPQNSESASPGDPVGNHMIQNLIHHVMGQATAEGDMDFFRKTFRKPPQRKKLNQGLANIHEFLVDFWCLQCKGLILERTDLPPLCFFTDEALTDYCAHALAIDPANIGDVGMRRRRLHLTQAKAPKIRNVIPHPDGLLLT